MGRIIILMLLRSEIIGGYNTPDTMERKSRLGHEIKVD